MRQRGGRTRGRTQTVTEGCVDPVCSESETSSDVTSRTGMLLNPSQGVSMTLCTEIYHLLSGVWEAQGK